MEKVRAMRCQVLALGLLVHARVGMQGRGKLAHKDDHANNLIIMAVETRRDRYLPLTFISLFASATVATMILSLFLWSFYCTPPILCCIYRLATFQLVMVFNYLDSHGFLERKGVFRLLGRARVAQDRVPGRLSHQPRRHVHGVPHRGVFLSGGGP